MIFCTLTFEKILYTMKIKWKKIVYSIYNIFFSYILKKEIANLFVILFKHPGH
jgi:hypothetical protein